MPYILCRAVETLVKLKGRNRIRKSRRFAERLASKIALREGIAGVVFIGGLVRGFTDKYSDLDIITFLGQRDENLRMQIRKMSLDEEKRSGVDVDLEVHFLEDFKRWKWDEADRWEFSRAQIVFDPEGRVEKVFKEKLQLPKDFWIKRIVVCSEYLKWYCCPPKEGVGTIAEAWVDRGDLLAAHYCLNYAVDLLLKVLFALNKEFLPAPKWRIFYSYDLRWLPDGYKKLIRQVMSAKDFSVSELNRRLRAIRELWRLTMPKIEEETGLTPYQISRYYVEKVLHQT